MDSFSAQQAILARIETGFAKEIRKEKDRFSKEQAKKLFTERNISSNDVIVHQKRIEKILEKNYKKTIRSFYFAIEKDVLKNNALPLEVKSAFWESLLIEWMLSYGFRQAGRIASTSASDLGKLMAAAILDDNIQNERGFIAYLLRSLGLNAWRSLMIARTETGMAASFASKKTAEKIASEKKIKLLKTWVAAEDDRTRVNHADVSGEELPLDRNFLVGGKLMDRPKDPNGGAGNVINCRCVLTYRRVKD